MMIFEESMNIAYELQSPENASGQLERIEERIMNLDQMPERYGFYDRTVSVMRVMYGGRDMDTQLNKYTKY